MPDEYEEFVDAWEEYLDEEEETYELPPARAGLMLCIPETGDNNEPPR